MKFFLAFFLSLTIQISYSQNIGIGTNTPHASAALEIQDSSKGILIPRMTMSQRTAIQSPAEGLMVYQTDSTYGFWYWGRGQWRNYLSNNVISSGNVSGILGFTEYVIPNDSSYYWGNAIVSTSYFNYNGHQDWRIPSPSELISLFGRFGTGSIPSGSYWTNDPFGTNPNCVGCSGATYWPKYISIGGADYNNVQIGPVFGVANPSPYYYYGNRNPDKARVIYIR
jgi:hypothetical protein